MPPRCWEWCKFTHGPTGNYVDLRGLCKSSSVAGAEFGGEGLSGDRAEYAGDYGKHQCGVRIRAEGLSVSSSPHRLTLSSPYKYKPCIHFRPIMRSEGYS